MAYCSCFVNQNNFAQSAGDVEYTDYFSAKGVRSSANECPRYDTKQSEGEVPVMENAEHPFFAIAPRSSLDWNGSTW